LRTELLTRTQTQKARITELESEAVLLREQVEKAVTTMRAAVIDVPLKRLATEISPVPELFLSELAKDYNVEPNEDGTLPLLAKDGKRVNGRDGKPVELTHIGLYTLLAGVNGSSDSERAKVFKVLLKYAGASGGNGRTNTTLQPNVGNIDSDKPLPTSFGVK
jgi:hypothetical protein